MNYFVNAKCKCGDKLHWDNVNKKWFCMGCADGIL